MIAPQWPEQLHRRGCAILFACLCCIQSAPAIELTELSGAAHGYPALRDLNGEILADAEFLQWAEGNRLHVRLIYRFKNQRRIEENDVFRQRPEVIQEQYSWRETVNDQVVREFRVNFGTRIATARKRENGELKHWEEKLEIEPGKTFAGFGFSLALQNLRARLLEKELIELKGIGFKPKPAMLAVEISHAGLERMEMAGRIVRGDHFVVHPKSRRSQSFSFTSRIFIFGWPILRRLVFCVGKRRLPSLTIPSCELTFFPVTAVAPRNQLRGKRSQPSRPRLSGRCG